MPITGPSRAEIVRRFIEEIWNKRQSDAIGFYIAQTFVDQAYEPHDAVGHKRMVETLRTVIPNALWTIEAIVETGETVMVELTLTGTHRSDFAGIPANGNEVRIRGYRTFVFEEDRIIEHRALLDTHTLLEQMKKKRAA